MSSLVDRIKGLFSEDIPFDDFLNESNIVVAKTPPYGVVSQGVFDHEFRYPEDPKKLTDFVLNLKENLWKFYLLRPEKFEGILEKAKYKICALDTETIGVFPFSKGTDIICFTFSFGDKAYYCPLKSKVFSEDLLVKYNEFFIDFVKTGKFIFQNGFFDLTFIKHKYYNQLKDVRINYMFDTWLGAHILTGGGLPNYNLQYLSSVFCDAPEWKDEPKEYLKEHYRRVEDRTMDKVPLDILVPYTCHDSYYTYKLYSVLEEKLTKTKMRDFHYKVQNKTSQLCLKMQEDGFFLDAWKLNFYEDKFEEYREKALHLFLELLIDRIQIKIGTEISQEQKDSLYNDFNVDSNPQLSQYLFDLLGFPVINTTEKTKQPKVGVNELIAIGKYDPALIGSLLVYRKWSSFLEFLVSYRGYGGQELGQQEDVNYCTHPNIQPFKTISGRTASKDPNSQNIHVGSGLKSCFTTPDRARVLYTLNSYIAERNKKIEDEMYAYIDADASPKTKEKKIKKTTSKTKKGAKTSSIKIKRETEEESTGTLFDE